MSLENKTVLIPKVSLEDIDDAAFLWIKNLQLRATTNAEEHREIPVYFAAQGRWAAFDQSKGLRDQNGTLILPAIAVRRKDVDRTPGLWAVGTDTKYIPLSRVLDERTYRRTGKAVYKTIKAPFPTFASVSYEVRFWTNSMEHANTIMEGIFAKLEWRQEILTECSRGFQFLGMFDLAMSNEGNLEEFTDEKRMCAFSGTLTIYGYLHPEMQAKVEYSLVEAEMKAEVSNSAIDFFTELTPLDRAADLFQKLSSYQKPIRNR